MLNVNDYFPKCHPPQKKNKYVFFVNDTFFNNKNVTREKDIRRSFTGIWQDMNLITNSEID